jgi:hypothetical protein
MFEQETYCVLLSVIKSRMNWVKHVSGRRIMCARFWWENVKVRDHCEDLDIDGRILLQWIFKK